VRTEVSEILRSLEDHGGLDELTDTSSVDGELLVGVSRHVLSFFIALSFETNFSLNLVVDGHGDGVERFPDHRVATSFDKSLAFFSFKTIDSSGVENFKNGCHSLRQGVDHVDRSLVFDVKAIPDSRTISIFVFVFRHVDELLVVDGAPRRHGGEKGVDVHCGHGSLRKAHNLFNVSRADVHGKATSNFGNHQGQHHAKHLRVHTVFSTLDHF